MMTRKDYVAVAEILSKYVDKVDNDYLSDLARDFSDMFQKDNERFDYLRFLKAVFNE
jgi:hypothetical protein